MTVYYPWLCMSCEEKPRLPSKDLCKECYEHACEAERQRQEDRARERAREAAADLAPLMSDYIGD